MSADFRNVVLLAGGVGGARFAEGLQQVLPRDALTVVANIGDDDDFYGLAVSPDLDTLFYTLSGQIDRLQGWGVREDSAKALEMIRSLGAPSWMKLGDADFGLHIWRTWQLGLGRSLTEVCKLQTEQYGLGVSILPVSDDKVRTKLLTDNGLMDLQSWFVGARCEPVVKTIHFEGIDSARASSVVLTKIAQADLILFAPSNPFLSIDPILAVAGIREAITRSAAPRIGVSPLINGKSVKGPLVKLMGELDLPATSAAIARRYGGLLDGFVVDRDDRSEFSCADPEVLGTNIFIADKGRSASLALDVLHWASGALVSGEALA